MARLCFQFDGLPEEVFELRLGVNRIGRNPENDLRLDHPSVSGVHCELTLTEEGVMVRDCGSTNGTFINHKRIQREKLLSGQVLRVGAVRLNAEQTEVTVAIPQFDVPRPAPPVVLENGLVLCPRHPQALANYQCTHCRELMCEACLHRLRRRGGKVHLLCPLCSHRCRRVGAEQPRKRSFLRFLRKPAKARDED